MKKYSASEKALERMDYYIKENGLKEHRTVLLQIAEDVALGMLHDYRDAVADARDKAYQMAQRIQPTKKRAK